MNFLEELKSIINNLGIAVETGVFNGTPSDEYVVITPMSDIYVVFADNKPEYETQEARLSLFKKSNYIARKKQLTKSLLSADFTITERRYVGHEDDTGFFHYSIDVMKAYNLETEE
ncbi:MAG: hypothetical protein ACYCWE_19470 [Eubacteriales bacterium]